MDIFSGIGSLIGGVVKVFQTDAETRQIREQGNRDIQRKKIDLKKARIDADIEIAKQNASNDLSYDMQALKNRKETITDDIIIFGFIAIFVLTFYPSTQPYMAIGWKALKNAPWWFEFGIVGILVSTLGLKDVLRMFLNAKSSFFKKKEGVN